MLRKHVPSQKIELPINGSPAGRLLPPGPEGGTTLGVVTHPAHLQPGQTPLHPFLHPSSRPGKTLLTQERYLENRELYEKLHVRKVVEMSE